MANAGASIEAVLTLNATGFQNGITKSIESLNKLNSSKTGISQLNQAIIELDTSLREMGTISKSSLNNFSKLSNAINKMANGLRILQSDSINVVEAVNTMNSIFKAFQGSLGSVTVRLDGVVGAERQLASSTNSTSASFERTIASINRNSEAMRKNAVEILRNMGYKGKLSAEETKETSATNQNTSAHQRNASAMSQSTSRANQLTSATSRLSKAMSSLRMIGSLVGSMLAYNFAHKLLVATGETIHAKSEMEGYFKMLNFGQSDIDGFNQALDRTVQQFQRVNKYSLGETISSIGVEFNLTTQEMEKAMKVTSMITSEYLRAGRNANEASLAVKDVLQGQFQRLSRETGVKGEQLKEAGWSGDTTDVLGLMEALEKVGESRNWDVFAEKANSLNDILTITQNRFGEWSADMVYKVQPAIVSAFNGMMTVASLFGEVIGGVTDFLSGDGLGSQIAKWTLLGTTIATVTGALISYRTGASLVQIAQMGLTRSLTATVLGLNAETVATYGTRTAIYSKIFGLEAEKVSELSTKDAILSKILGLDAEIVAEEGLKDAITTSAFAREVEAMQLRGATEEEIANTFALYQNQLAQKSSIGLLSAQALNLDMTTYAEHGFTVALLESTTALEGETIAMMGLNSQIALLIASIGIPVAIVGAFAVALGQLAMRTMDATEKMSKFYDLQQHGEQYINDARSSVTNLEKKIKDLTETQKKYTQGSKEYENVGSAIDSLNDKLELAKSNIDANYEAYQRVVSAQEKYDTSKQEAQLDLQLKINQALVDTGLSTEEANELSNNYLSDAIDGANQLYKALQSVTLQYEKEAQGVAGLTDYWSSKGLSGEEIAVKVKPYIDAHEDLNSHIEKMKLSSDVVTVVTEWINVQYNQIKLSLAENVPKIEAGDYAGGLTGLLKGLAHGLADLPVFGEFWDWVFEKLNVKENYGGKGWAGLEQAFSDFINYLLKSFSSNGFSQILFDNLKSTIDTALSGFNLFDIIMDAIFPDPVSAEDGGATPSFMEDLSNIFGFDVQNWINNFMSDPLGTLGVQPIDIGQILFPQLFGLVDGAMGIATWVDTNLIQPLKTGISTGIASIPILSDVLALLGWIPQANGDAQSKGQQLMKAFGDAVEHLIASIPILSDILRMLGIIPQANPTASSNGQGVGQAIKDGFKSGITGIVDIITSELNHIIEAIKGKIEEARKWASELGGAIVNGVKNAIDPGSPGIIARDIIGGEFGTYIPQVILENSEKAYSVAQEYGTKIKEGISSVGTTMSFDGMVDTYESDAQIVAESSQLMGTTTSMAFNDMSMQVNSSVGQMQTNVTGAYSSIATNQNTMLNNMKQKNTTAYNDMYQKSNQSLIQMRDSTSNITHQMTNAWNSMKNSIVASAHQLQSESTVHFNNLSNTIGSFYRKIQNPSSWGGSPHGGSTHRNVGAGRTFASAMRSRGYSGGTGKRYSGGRGSIYHGSNTMTIAQLKKMVCPSGDCSIFDGYSATDRVDVRQFLSMITEGGFGGWDFSKEHYDYIKKTSDEWSMKSPTIQLKGGIPTNADYYVKDFENGEPKISFSAFQSMAESIFSAIPYRFYYNSDWKGSWLGALQAGACNCFDGANALVAFASSCGFSGHTEGGTWVDPDGTTYPHVFAVINGKKMDTTGWQQRRSWSAGSPNIRTASHNPPSTSNNNAQRTVNITLNFNEPVYGVDDLDSRIKNGVKEGLREEFNDPYTVVI